jgi:hypothetical protein
LITANKPSPAPASTTPIAEEDDDEYEDDDEDEELFAPAASDTLSTISPINATLLLPPGSFFKPPELGICTCFGSWVVRKEKGVVCCDAGGEMCSKMWYSEGDGDGV